MPQITLELPAELHDALARHAVERGESIKKSILTYLVLGLAAPPAVQDAAPGEPRCSFCGKPREEIRHMVTGRDARICAECVAECSRLLDRGKREAPGGSAP